LRGYDARGNLAWQSLPLSWADASSGTVGQGSRTEFQYDALNRPLRTLAADGAETTQSYEASNDARYGAAIAMPALRSRDAQCYDAAAANTPCLERLDVVDEAGRRIRADLEDTG